ncbi:MAG: SCO family protein, partial [Alphaproteobacteria bacterium]
DPAAGPAGADPVRRGFRRQGKLHHYGGRAGRHRGTQGIVAVSKRVGAYWRADGADCGRDGGGLHPDLLAVPAQRHPCARLGRLVTGRRLLLRAGVLGGIAGVAALTIRHGPADVLAGTPVTPSPAPPLDLIDVSGEPFTLSALSGSPAWVTFGYTACPDVCPTLLATLATARDLASARSERIGIVFVTLDPAKAEMPRLA